MSDHPNPTPADWAEAARENLRDARRLRNNHSWRNAYMLAGAALECALKARIMRHLGLNRWPTRSERRDLYTHDLTVLAELAGLTDMLEQAASRSEAVGLAWMVAKDFSINRRYPTGRPFPMRLGRDMIAAAEGQDGLVEWLIRP